MQRVKVWQSGRVLCDETVCFLGDTSFLSMEDVTRYENVAKNVFTYGSVSLALAMATETNMVQCLCTADTPLSSTDIATQLKLKERYVREVLNSLTAVGLVHLEAGTGGQGEQQARYWVPLNCRQLLKSYSVFAVFIPVSAQRYADLRKCFDSDGPYGVRYSAEAYQAMDRMAEMLGDTIITAILKTPGLRERLEKGVKALEVGCGTGWLSLGFAERFPKSQFTLTDPMTQPLEMARKQAEKKGLSNVSFQILDIFYRPVDLVDESFDWIISVEVIHDLPYPLKALQEIYQMLKPDGHFSMVEHFMPSTIRDSVGNTDAAAFHSLGTFLCLPESFQQLDSQALGPCWGGDNARRLMQEAGFSVSGVTRSDSLGTMAVFMAHKAGNQQQEKPEKE